MMPSIKTGGLPHWRPRLGAKRIPPGLAGASPGGKVEFLARGMGWSSYFRVMVWIPEGKKEKAKGLQSATRGPKAQGMFT